MEKQLKWFAVVNIILTAGVIGAVVWGIYNHQAVIDWWRLATYKPPAAIALLADHATMIGSARDLFFESEPTVESGSAFNQDCNNTSEQTIVLGCYTHQSIYLFNVTDPRLVGVKEVTAAHEMLHAAYDRMSDSEKQWVNGMVADQLKTVTDQRILGLIDSYNKSEPGELYNEMHSILGTEYRNLSPDLEAYYSRYFSDRKKIVSYSENYEAVFTASKLQLAQMDAQLASWQAQINSDNATLDQEQPQLLAQSAALAQLRNDGKVDEYNQAVLAYNAKVQAFNALVDGTKRLVNQYNALVTTRNQQATAQNNLYQSLDSRHQTVQMN